MRNNRLPLITIVLVAALAGTLSPARCVAESSSPSLLEAVANGTFSLNLRYRYEDVDQSTFPDRGRASTLRTVASYTTGEWKGFDVTLELEDIHDLGLSSEHNNAGSGSLSNGVLDRPVIADPEITEINQVFLGWRPTAGLPIRLGLQEIVIDNHRFVGNVLWRQNHQSFEAVRADFTGIDDLTLSYSFIDRQHTVTGASLPMSTSHLGIAYSFDSVGTLKGYALVLDYDDPARSTLNSTTYGAFFDGVSALTETLDLRYRAEIARQDDTSNPRRIRADYLRGDLGLRVSSVSFGIGYEALSGSEADGQFNTPLATLHKFNGWADQFLVTPTEGLEDLFLTVSAALGRFKLVGVYHDFSAATGGASWGSEVDAEVVYTAPWKQRFALKFADYSADEHGTDTRKLWVWTSWGF